MLSDLTLFDGVRMLPGRPHADRQRGRHRARGATGTSSFDPDDGVSEEEWTERIRGVFEEVVTRQLISDVPVGSYLSGGMDSASIAAVASRNVPRLMTFTGGFDLSSVTGLELVFDERADAELVASHFRTQHYEMVMHAGDMAWALPELVWHLEDLRVGMSYPNYYIAGLASKFVKVALGGAGGDELFAGYPWRYELVRGLDDAQAFDAAYYDYWARLVPDGEKQLVLHAGRPRARWRPLAVRALPPDDASLRPGSTRSRRRSTSRPRPSCTACSWSRTRSRWRTASRCACRSSTTSWSRSPRRSRAGSSTVRAAARSCCATRWRRCCRPSIVEKRKQGFSPPDQSWYRGPTMDYIREMLLDRRSLDRGYFEPRVRRSACCTSTSRGVSTTGC